MKVRRSIRRQMALSATCLVLAVVAVIAGVAYREVRRSALASAAERLTGVSQQVTDMFAVSALQVKNQIALVAADTGINAYLGRSGPQAS
jgi:hypothetical protein